MESCRFQKLFGTDGELEDEDFLSAVEDAENQFVIPGYSSPSDAPINPPNKPHPTKPHPTKPHPSKPTLRPLAGQGEHPSGFQGPPPRGAAPQDELDNELFLAACKELEGPEVPAGSGAAAPLPPGHRENPTWIRPGKENTQECGIPKKLRVGEEPIPTSRGVQDRQDPLPSPKVVLRPSAAGSWTPRPPISMGKPGSSAGSRSIPALGDPSLRPFQAPLGGSSSSSVPQTPPALSCPQPQQPPRPPSRPPGSTEPPRPPLRTAPGFPNPTMVPNAPGPPNPPVVTNHLVQLVAAASKAPGGSPRVPSCRETRRFPGPAGILPQQHSGKLLEEILVSAPQTPAHGAVAKPRTQALPSSPLATEEDFGKGPWLAMKTELGLDERNPGCFLHTYSVVMVLRKAALKQLPKNKVPSMAVMIKSLSRTSAGAGAVFRDPTGEIQGTLHRLLLEERQSELRPGSVLLLRQVGVFSPSHRNHYLNVTPNNLLRIFPPEPEGGCSQRQVPAQAGLIPDPPVQPPQGVPVPGDWGQPRTSGHSTEEHPGVFSLHPPSPGPRQEEPVGADGCDMDDLDGLLGELPEDFFSAPAQADCG
ncbi:homologous recombination OB-fold protein isoform X2 [Myiozetetes cayanensis]|uniref:homologous recombination OB-fold protein isoform X2 n=1 Tax=Myiozetetes cayanensis TaxID=478635 RepID=UPI0021608D2F|nr:homologous recombination OB-fold protein isoform X2 [Myiozetetes cayanensis]